MTKLGDLKIDPVELGSQGNAVLGIRASGKSYLGTLLGERLMDAGVPIIAFDPIGVWRYLKVPGSNGVGYPVVVAGGEHGDLPLTPDGAPEIVRAAMQAGVSLVLDLYSMNLSKADWRRIVERCVRVLLYENKAHGLRHVFIEEAAEFAPQIVGRDYGTVYAEIEKLARMGGNALLGYTLISQRAEQVNKAVLELCDNLFLFRQKGRLSLTALSKWLDIGSAKGGGEIITSLPTLPQGTCWAWAAGSDTPIKITVPTKKSFHPDRSKMHGELAEEIVNKSAVDVSAFVETMKGGLEKITAEAEANDPKRLKAEIERLKKLADEPQIKGHTDDEMFAEYKRGRMDGYDHGVAQGQVHGLQTAAEKFEEMAKWFSAEAERYRGITADHAQRNRAPIPAPVRTETPKLHKAGNAPPIVAQANGAESMSPSSVKLVDAIVAAYPMGMSLEAAAKRAGLSRRSSAFTKYLREAAASPRIQRREDGRYVAVAAEEGIRAPAGLEDFKRTLPPSYARMLEALEARSDDALTKDEIADASGVSRTSSGLGAGLKELVALGLADDFTDGTYRLSQDFA